MSLNKTKGNMYGFITHTWGPITGFCPHDCIYCYMKSMVPDYQNVPLQLKDKYINDFLGAGRFIFVGQTCDMFAEMVPDEWLKAVLKQTRKFDNNQYLFQSKNPARMLKYCNDLPSHTILATTIETNRLYGLSKAPIVESRAAILKILSKHFYTMLTIEPIVDFDLPSMRSLIETASPKMIVIGADSKKNNLSEPSADKINELVAILKSYDCKLVIKDNLTRLLS